MQQRVLAIYQKLTGPDSPDVAMALMNLANSYKELGRPTEAVPLYERALGIFTQKFGEDSGLVADALGAMGRLELDRGQFEEAGRNFVRAFAVHERVIGPQHPSLIFTLRSLAYLTMRPANNPQPRF